MNDRVKVKIKHRPVKFFGVFTWSMMFLVPATIISLAAEAAGVSIFLAVLLIADIIAIYVLLSAKALITADHEKIRCRYMKKDSFIMICDIEEISYSVYAERYGKFFEERLMLSVKTRDGKQHSFNDSFSAEAFAAALDGNGETDIPIINLYRFLAGLIPEKARGCVKTEESDIFL